MGKDIRVKYCVNNTFIIVSHSFANGFYTIFASWHKQLYKSCIDDLTQPAMHVALNFFYFERTKEMGLWI